MRKIWFLSFVVIAVLCGIAFRSHAEGANLRGEYVEARTASVFAGACHYNGELTTTGRDAMMAWNVTSGRWKGVDLAGVRAMAIVSSDANLAEINAAHRSEVLIDSAASDAQATALVDALKTKYAASLGSVTSVRRTPIEFNHEGKTFTASAEKLASIDVDAMPNDECCKMPNLVWYSPLVPLESRKVGYTTKAFYAGNAVGDAWQRSGENSAFYGSFSL